MRVYCTFQQSLAGCRHGLYLVPYSVLMVERDTNHIAFTVERGEVTSSHVVRMSEIQQRQPLATGSDVTASQDGGAHAADDEDEEPSLCCKNDLQTVATTSLA